MRHQLEELARRAGGAILEVYRDRGSWQLEDKEDGSPVTAADLAAHALIAKGLRELSGAPVVSEEDFWADSFPPEESSFWLVDPLDGTRDFVKETGHFTVNIALIEDGAPSLGVVYAPVTGDLYSAFEGRAYKNGKPLMAGPLNASVVAGVSNFHSSPELKSFLSRNQITTVQKTGSSLKFCLLAEGLIDVYPRFSPTSQWDTAAGQAVAEASGIKVLKLADSSPLSYGHKSIINPPFIACKAEFTWI